MQAIKNILTGAFLLTVSLASAQTVYSLQDCIRQGLANNYSLRIAQEKEQQLKNTATMPLAGFSISADIDGSYGGSNESTRLKDRETDMVSKTGPSFNQTLDAGASISVSLFEGLRILNENRRNKQYWEKGEIETRIAMENLISDIAEQYYELIYLNTGLKNLKNSMELSRERVRTATVQRQAGSSSLLEYNQARVDFNADSSRYTQQKVLLNTAQVRLNVLMASYEVEQKIAVADTAIVLNKELDYEQLRESMLDKNSYLLQAIYDKTISELDYKVARADYFPTLSLNGGYGYGVSYMQTGENKSRQDLGPTYGITLRYNLFNGFRTRNQVRNAKIGMDIAQLSVSDMEVSLLGDLADLYFTYRNNIELAELEVENVAAAKHNYDIAFERFTRLGNLSGLELREAQLSLLNAQERLINAQYLAKVCEISLLNMSGGLLGYVVSFYEGEVDIPQ